MPGASGLWCLPVTASPFSLGIAWWQGRKNCFLHLQTEQGCATPQFQIAIDLSTRRCREHVNTAEAACLHPVPLALSHSLAQIAARKQATSWLEVSLGKLAGWWWTWRCCQKVCSSMPCKKILFLVVCWLCSLLGAWANLSGLLVAHAEDKGEV